MGNGPQPPPLLVKDQIARNAGIVLDVRVVVGQRAYAGILRRWGVLIHEAPSEAVHSNPWHWPLVVAKARVVVTQGHRDTRQAKAVSAVNVPHMPQRSACLLSHPDSVTRVAQRAHGDGALDLEVVSQH